MGRGKNEVIKDHFSDAMRGWRGTAQLDPLRGGQETDEAWKESLDIGAKIEVGDLRKALNVLAERRLPSHSAPLRGIVEKVSQKVADEVYDSPVMATTISEIMRSSGLRDRYAQHVVTFTRPGFRPCLHLTNDIPGRQTHETVTALCGQESGQIWNYTLRGDWKTVAASDYQGNFMICQECAQNDYLYEETTEPPEGYPVLSIKDEQRLKRTAVPQLSKWLFDHKPGEFVSEEDLQKQATSYYKKQFCQLVAEGLDAQGNYFFSNVIASEEYEDLETLLPEGRNDFADLLTVDDWKELFKPMIEREFSKAQGEQVGPAFFLHELSELAAKRCGRENAAQPVRWGNRHKRPHI